jgi:hypothetical protein
MLSNNEIAKLPTTERLNHIYQDQKYSMTTLYFPIYSTAFYTGILDAVIEKQQTPESKTSLFSVEDLSGYPSKERVVKDDGTEEEIEVTRSFFDRPLTPDEEHVTDSQRTDNLNFWGSIVRDEYLQAIRDKNPKPENYFSIVFEGILDVKDPQLVEADFYETVSILQNKFEDIAFSKVTHQKEKRKEFSDIQKTQKEWGASELPAEVQKALIGLGEYGSAFSDAENISIEDQGTLVTLSIPDYQDVHFQVRYIGAEEGHEENDLYIINVTELFSALKAFGRTLPAVKLGVYDSALQSNKNLILNTFGRVFYNDTLWLNTTSKTELLAYIKEMLDFAVKTAHGSSTEKEALSIMENHLKRYAGFNLFKEYDYTGGTWKLNKKSKTITRKPPLNVESAIKNKGAWSYNINDEVLVDIDAFEFSPAVVEARLPGLQYQVRTSSGKALTINEKDIVDATEDLF